MGHRANGVWYTSMEIPGCQSASIVTAANKYNETAAEENKIAAILDRNRYFIMDGM